MSQVLRIKLLFNAADVAHTAAAAAHCNLKGRECIKAFRPDNPENIFHTKIAKLILKLFSQLWPYHHIIQQKKKFSEENNTIDNPLEQYLSGVNGRMSPEHKLHDILNHLRFKASKGRVLRKLCLLGAKHIKANLFGVS